MLQYYPAFILHGHGQLLKENNLSSASFLLSLLASLSLCLLSSQSLVIGQHLAIGCHGNFRLKVRSLNLWSAKKWLAGNSFLPKTLLTLLWNIVQRWAVDNNSLLLKLIQDAHSVTKSWRIWSYLRHLWEEADGERQRETEHCQAH